MSDRLLDRIAIVELVSRYCRGIDRRDFALVRSLYHDDAIDEHGSMFRGGPDEFVAWLPQVTAAWELTRHEISNSVVAIDKDRAEGEHLVRAWHRTPPPDRREFIIHGRYLDRYERRAGEWKFYHRQLVLDHAELRPVDETVMAQLGGEAPHGISGSGDPSWRLDLLARLGR
ncbi:MAG: nuclear transport factor 2 family protein [Novosphingobium sp.]|nr:nuclear transport factor 2 family protein [Novosphingobium sp.]MCB2080663.1 nuclear transport factor 2 family protein [Novosphingobium sp.]